MSAADPPLQMLITILLLYVQRSDGFNYDYSSACTRPYRNGRQFGNIENIAPCDLSKQTYCNRPGSAYPWHAVRRFVHENQGLMRRMYGEQRHISVLKAEIENNELDDEIYNLPTRDTTFARQSKDRDIINTKFVYSKRASGRSRESFTVPHFRPVQTTMSTTPNQAKDTKKSESESKDSTNKIKEDKTSPHKQSFKNQNDEKMAAYKTSFFEDEINIQDINKNNLELNKIEPEMISLKEAIKQSLETNKVYPSYGSPHKNVTYLSTTMSQTIETSPTESTTPEYVTSAETTLPPDTADISTEDSSEEMDGWKPVVMDKMSTLPPTMLFSQSVKEENKNDRIDMNAEASESSSVASDAGVSTNLEGQLFQDAVQEEPKPVVKLRGVNACPVKEEVVAPFWANNTRGEVLALLNLYPFEQYVHWEKCAHEHKQMFCREGCRCEQQFRLHRLLAYDPNNECRGIFADWFRFPSCCVCKCYDMPLEFRVTSRSPRTIEPDIEESVKKEMYAQAASDWYTINFDD